RAVLPAMRARRAGHIVNVTSVSGVATWAGTGIYCASKFALEGAALTLADEVADFGIKVTNIEPGGMRTDYSARSLRQVARVIDDYADVAHAARRILADHAGHEPGDPAKVAAAILKVVDAENPPRQLLLGADAIHYATRHMARFQAEIGAWAPLSLSTGFEEA
ncbi:MAG TPA: SDR family NAD(P)-dependent oxidoreductase, partial [Caulobacteraceae bacterium]|nr:SDR family NAD(P)-dependent oxidoreductase [Caulobacteraceae bacterium]